MSASHNCYKKWVNNSPTYASGGSTKVFLQDLPYGRLLGFLLRLKLDITQDGAGAIIPGDMLYRIFDLVRISDRVRVTGRGLFFLEWLMRGMCPQLPADVPLAAGVYSRVVSVWIPFADFAQESPRDTAVNTRLLVNQAIDINWGNFTALFGAHATATGSVRCIAFVDKPKPQEIASDTEIDFIDDASHTVLMSGEVGAISHMLAYQEDSDALTDTLYATFTIYVDGEVITPVVETGELLAEFNFMRAHGTSPLALSATVPIGGEVEPDEPGVAVGAGAGLTFPMIPLVIPPTGEAGYQITHLPHAQAGMRLDYTGTATSIRILQRRIRESDRARTVDNARAAGIVDPGSRELGVKVSSFGTLTAAGAKLLPKTIKMSREEILRQGGV